MERDDLKKAPQGNGHSQEGAKKNIHVFRLICLTEKVKTKRKKVM